MRIPVSGVDAASLRVRLLDNGKVRYIERVSGATITVHRDDCGDLFFRFLASRRSSLRRAQGLCAHMLACVLSNLAVRST